MALSRVRILSLGYLKIHSLSHRPVRLDCKIYHYWKARAWTDVAAPSAQLADMLHLLLFLSLFYMQDELVASNFTDLDTGTRFAVDATQGVSTAKQYDARAERTR